MAYESGQTCEDHSLHLCCNFSARIFNERNVRCYSIHGTKGDVGRVRIFWEFIMVCIHRRRRGISCLRGWTIKESNYNPEDGQSQEMCVYST